MFIEKVKESILKQIEKEEEYSAVRCCAQQLIDIIDNDEKAAELVFNDFENGGMTVQGAEKTIKDWVDKNHKGNSGFCPHHKADELIRTYFASAKDAITSNSYKQEPSKVKSASKKVVNINLADFL